ncbi:hypothetical protein FKM82_024416 [Ascaphus truei]
MRVPSSHCQTKKRPRSDWHEPDSRPLVGKVLAPWILDGCGVSPWWHRPRYREFDRGSDGDTAGWNIFSLTELNLFTAGGAGDTMLPS